MYLELFKLQDLPFRLSPDPSFLYLSKHHARAKAYMESTIWFTDGFVVITGEIGSGKTTLIETFLRELEKDVVVAQVNQTQLSPIEFLQGVLVQFGFSPFKMKKAEVLSTLNTFLIEQYANNRKVLLIVDEAQNLSDRVLEEVRLLSGVETTKEKVLRIILAGQPELNEKLNSPELLQLTQRIRLRFHLTPLSKADTRAYVQHRLEVAGSQGRQIFDEACFGTVFRYTGGTPRLINTLCDTAMMAAFARDRDTVALEDIETAIRELQWVEFTARTPRAAIAPGVATTMPVTAPAPATPERSAAPVAPTQVARVLLASQGQTVLERPLRPGRLIIGRTPDNDLQIDSKFISRHHCQIITTAESCVIEDLNSTNGIYVKAKRVRKHNLNDGDVVVIGKHELMYIDERVPKQRHTSEPLEVPTPTSEQAWGE
jgi:type II secretory pathway predicted ATPase ExeA/pSer/pThr/pTyr-binding forkhead associated (FHA) protein